MGVEDLGDVRKGEGRLLTSLEEEIMEEEADEERTSVGKVGGRSFGVNLLLLCRFPTGAGERKKVGVGVVSSSELRGEKRMLIGVVRGFVSLGGKSGG